MVRITTAAALIAALGIVGPAQAAPKSPKSKVRFAQAAHQVVEGATSVAVTLKRTRNVNQAVSVQWSTADGTATAGSDYDAAGGVVTFASGETEKTVEVAIRHDEVVEPNETITLSLRSAGSGVAGGAASQITIVDNDGDVRFSFAAASESAGEDAGTVAIEVVRSGVAGGNTSVAYAATGGTAGPADYGLSPGTLTFTPGEYVKSFDVAITQNGAAGDNGRTVELALSSPSVGTVAAPATTTLTILDDDTPPVLTFAPAAVTVGEGAGTALLTVSRAGFYTGDEVMVDVVSADGTALAGADYEALEEQVVLEIGEDTATVEIPVSQDALDEGDETFTAALSNAAGATIGSPDSVTVTIADDDTTVVEEPEQPQDPETPPSDPGTTPATGDQPPAAPATGGVEQSSAFSADVSILRKRVKRTRGVKLQVSCALSCTAALGGKAGKAKLKSRTLSVAGGTATKVKLRLSKKQLRRLAGRKRARVVITMRATDASGAVVTVTRKLKLRV